MKGKRSDYKDVTVTCRAPRAVISFDASADWESRAAIVIAAMGKYWGGSQFILLPHVDHKINPALLRLASIHDPDHVFEFNFSNDELAKCAGTYQPPERELRPAELMMRPAYHSRPPESLFEATSVYRMEMVDRRPPTGSVFMTSDHMGPMTLLEDMPGGHNSGVYQAVPAECGGTIGLAMAMRAGFVEPPTLPFAMDPNFTLDPQDFGYALGRSNPTNKILTSTGGLAVANPVPSTVIKSWQRTEPGLGKVIFTPEILQPAIAVVGSTAEDFCLAFALDRMTGHVLWLPGDLLADQQNIENFDYAIFDFLNDTYQRSAASVITSVSWTKESLDQLVEERFRSNFVVNDLVLVPYISPSDVGSRQPAILACMPSDFGIQLTLPTIEDGTGGIDLSQSIPVIVPECVSLAPKRMPFWEVDVTIQATTTPMGRNSPHEKIETDPGHFGITTARSSQAGVSFHAQSQGLIMAGQPIRHAIARPKLRFPNLLEWVQARTSATAPYSEVLPSDAGRRAMLAADLFGSRDQLAEGLQTYAGFFREFLPPIAKKGTPYPEEDGFFIKDLDGAALSFRAAMRVLHPIVSTPATRIDVRAQLDTMLNRSILRRGLVLRCYACRRVSFFAVDQIGQRNRCPGCNSKTPLNQTAWITRKDEPEWFYELHASVGGLINGNGDVPIMAGRYLAGLNQRPFTDVPELDFVSRERERPDEIDLVAHFNQQVLVGEAKSMDHLGDQIKPRNDAANKLIRVSQFLHADQIVLVSSAAGPWKETSVDTLRSRVEHSQWTYGPAPRIRLITGIGTETVKDVDVFGQPWKQPGL